MSAGLTRQALRQHPWSFVGTFVTQLLGAVLVSAALHTSSSLGSASTDVASRRVIDDSGVGEFATIIVMIAVYLSILIGGLTMSSAIARQQRDIALLRAIGAAPSRVRRAVATQAAVVALPAALLGVPLGGVASRFWVSGLVGHQVLPFDVAARPSATALPVALAIALVTSVVGALVAAVRPSRARPAVALTASVTAPRGLGLVRTSLGAVLVLGGVTLSVVVSRLSADTADSLGFFVVLAMCIGAGLLGPALLRAAAPLARRLGGTGALAADNVTVHAKALSGALVPLVLALGFSAIIVLRHTTTAHVRGVPESPAALWTEYTGTGVYAAYAAVAALTTLITVQLGRRAELAAMRLAGASRARMIAVVACEALLVMIVALLAATAVAAATLLPLLHTGLGTWTPYVPVTYLADALLGLIVFLALGTVLPAALLMRRPAITAADVGG